MFVLRFSLRKQKPNTLPFRFQTKVRGAGASKGQWLWCPGSHPSGQVGHWAVQQQARRPGSSEACPPGCSLFSSSSPPRESGVSGPGGGPCSLSPCVCGWSGACLFSSVWSDSCALPLSQQHLGPMCSHFVPLPTQGRQPSLGSGKGRRCWLQGEDPMGRACLDGWGVDIWHIEIYIL